MPKRLSNQSKLTFKPTTKQVQALGEILALLQDLNAIANSEKLAESFGTSKQLIQYHANKIKVKKEATK